MTYKTQNEIASNQMMMARVAQAYASEPLSTMDPDTWVAVHRRDWAAAPGWDLAWESSKASNPEPTYDPGADESVITDAMILSQVQSMITPVPPLPGP